MKIKLYLTLVILLFIKSGFSQVRVVDTDKPIASIEISYSANNNLTIILVLNSKENTQTVTGAGAINFKATVEGQISWNGTPADPSDRFVSGTFISSSIQTPFKFSTDIKYGADGKFVPTPSTRNWKSIEYVKIKYELDGKYNELPFFTIYPPTTSTNVVNKVIKIAGKGKYTSKRTGEISIESEPIGTAFEVTACEITKTVGSRETTTKLDAGSLGASRYANNGKINLKFNLGSDIDEANSTFKVKVGVKLIGTEEKIESSSTEVVFVDETPITIWNRPASYSITINDRDEFLDSDINVSGQGDLNIEFATKDYADLIRVTKTKVGNSYSFKLSGLSQIPDKTYSYFYYTNNGERISPPHLIVKESPVLTDFQFTGISNNSISMEFFLPQFVNEQLVSLNIIGSDGKDLKLSGNLVIKRENEGNKSKFIVTLPNSITELVDKDTIRDLRFNINYNATKLYSLGVKVFNQKLLNDKIAELISATSDKPNRRNKEEIKKTVESIVKIGEAVGNSIGEEDVTKAIDELKNGDKDKIKSVMSDIGKWALIAGKVILPLLI